MGKLRKKLIHRFKMANDVEYRIRQEEIRDARSTSRASLQVLKEKQSAMSNEALTSCLEQNAIDINSTEEHIKIYQEIIEKGKDEYGDDKHGLALTEIRLNYFKEERKLLLAESEKRGLPVEKNVPEKVVEVVQKVDEQLSVNDTNNDPDFVEAQAVQTLSVEDLQNLYDFKGSAVELPKNENFVIQIGKTLLNIDHNKDGTYSLINQYTLGGKNPDLNQCVIKQDEKINLEAGKEVIIGRENSPFENFDTNDLTMSRKHLIIEVDPIDNTVILTDTSSNGSSVCVNHLKNLYK